MSDSSSACSIASSSSFGISAEDIQKKEALERLYSKVPSKLRTYASGLYPHVFNHLAKSAPDRFKLDRKTLSVWVKPEKMPQFPLELAFSDSPTEMDGFATGDDGNRKIWAIVITQNLTHLVALLEHFTNKRKQKAAASTAAGSSSAANTVAGSSTAPEHNASSSSASKTIASSSSASKTTASSYSAPDTNASSASTSSRASSSASTVQPAPLDKNISGGIPKSSCSKESGLHATKEEHTME